MKKLHVQERAVEEVKLAIKPFYQRREVTKDEYKDILRKAVQKVSGGRRVPGVSDSPGVSERGGGRLGRVGGVGGSGLSPVLVKEARVAPRRARPRETSLVVLVGPLAALGGGL